MKQKSPKYSKPLTHYMDEVGSSTCTTLNSLLQLKEQNQTKNPNEIRGKEVPRASS